MNVTIVNICLSQFINLRHPILDIEPYIWLLAVVFILYI
nr:MAG TPA: hypothetical protein [Caudoviricetes sp.]